MRTSILLIAAAALALAAPGCDNHSDGEPDITIPGVDTAEPNLDTVEPAADTVVPELDTSEPLQDTVEPPPEDTVEPPEDAVDPPEDTMTPPDDAGPSPECGDGLCNGTEDPCGCPGDCPIGDGYAGAACCDAMDCSQPKCGPCCVVTCDAFVCSGETWLEPCCWNGECEEGEDWKTCPEDCPMPDTECEQEGGFCAPWDPGYTNCIDGTVPAGFACTSKSEVCCIEGEDPPPPACDDPAACLVDADCVKTAAGCCPCSMGGTSTAINGACVDAYNALLDCPVDLMCPAMYNCDDSTPACLGTQCVLVGGGFE